MTSSGLIPAYLERAEPRLLALKRGALALKRGLLMEPEPSRALP